ncbi:hypothetical protein [Micromonospora sp. U21]|uniref:hypothetical protein n=1 Tax=Micromonospora sp. U21 TaxID=2824899 RepID=UPI001B35CFFA|nr:hypothetical protein [Micromonospora sp. U21]MBQ0903575.1 hypothetical protein [Micromonospora sp. U21]
MKSSLRDLLVEALRLWGQEAFFRYSDSEVACTVRVYHWSVHVIRNNPRWAIYRMQYDGPQPTREMCEGVEDPARASRPDLNISVGQDVVVHVEAKRLKASGGLPRKYVTEGMRRFVDGRYETTSCGLGGMLGYILEDDPIQVIDLVNKTIVAEPDFGPTAVLRSRGRQAPEILEHTSDHAGFELHHFTLDLRS